MFKRNWSIWLLLGLVLGFILVQFFSSRITHEKRLTIESHRLPDMSLDFDIPADDSFVWETDVFIQPDESFYSASAYDGTAYYVTAINQLRQQYAYNYRLYQYATESELITELPDAKPHRLNIVALDTQAILFAKEYSDGRTALAAYQFGSGQYSNIAQWQGPPSRAKVSYQNNTVGLVVDNTWGIYNLQGQLKPVEYRLPSGSVVPALGVNGTEAFIYYEVDDLRYMLLYEFSNQSTTSFLVSDRVQSILMPRRIALTRAGNQLQLYRWPKMSVQRLLIGPELYSIQLINDQLVDIRLERDRQHMYVFDLSTQQWVFNQSIQNIPSAENQLYYYVPAVKRVNLLRFRRQ